MWRATSNKEASTVKKGRKKTIIIILAILVVAVVGIFLLTQGGNQVAYSQEIASTGTLATYYNFSGKIDVDISATITAPADATVKEIYVKTGDAVQKDTRLARLSDGTILKSDIAGEVTSLDAHVDKNVSAGETLMEIMNLDSMKVTFKVDEYDISAIQMGKEAEVTLDGSGYTFTGAITYLDKKANEESDLSYYNATIALDGITLPENTLPGMQVNVRILNSIAENAVLLKMDALSFTETNQAYVLMQGSGNTPAQVQVEVGINDGTYVEIVSGLRGGDTVLYVPAMTANIGFGMMGGGQN